MPKYSIKDTASGVPPPLRKVFPAFIEESAAETVRQLMEKYLPKEKGK